MEPPTSPHQPPVRPPVRPPDRARLFFSVLGIALLTSGLYILLTLLCYWLPSAYGDVFLEWAGPLGYMPPEGIWAAQSIIMRIMVCVLGLLLLYGFVGLFRRQRLRLPFAKITSKHLASLTKNTFAYFMVIIAHELIFFIFNIWRFIEEPAVETAPFGLLGNFLLLFFVAAAAPFFEEVLFRGFLFARLRAAFKFWPAFLVSGLLFGLLHFQPQASLALNAVGVVGAFVFAYFATRAFEETGNLWIPIFMHSLYNGWVFFLQLVASVFESLPAYVLSPQPGAWL